VTYENVHVWLNLPRQGYTNDVEIALVLPNSRENKSNVRESSGVVSILVMQADEKWTPHRLSKPLYPSKQLRSELKQVDGRSRGRGAKRQLSGGIDEDSAFCRRFAS
jgi:hypothetical protein